MGNVQEMPQQVKQLAEATSTLIDAIKGKAEVEADPHARKRLTVAATSLDDASAFVVEASKVATCNLQDKKAQESLRNAAKRLR